MLRLYIYSVGRKPSTERWQMALTEEAEALDGKAVPGPVGPLQILYGILWIQILIARFFFVAFGDHSA